MHRETNENYTAKIIFFISKQKSTGFAQKNKRMSFDEDPPLQLWTQ